jgi:profilin
LSHEEQTAVINAFKNPEQTQASGLRLVGEKYFAISVNDSIIQLKKSVCGSPYLVLALYENHTRGTKADGAVIAKTKQAIIVSIYKQPLQAGEATPVVSGWQIT